MLDSESPTEALPGVLQRLAVYAGALAALMIEIPAPDRMRVIAAHPQHAAADPVLLTQVGALEREYHDSAGGGSRLAELTAPGGAAPGISALLTYPEPAAGQPSYLLALIGAARTWGPETTSAARAVAAIAAAGLRQAGSAAELAELRELGEARFRQLAQFAPVGIAQTDTAGRIVFVNDRWTELTGRARHDAVGNSWTQVVHPGDLRRLERDRAAAFERGTEFRADCRLRPSGGHDTWVQVSVTALDGPDGKPAGGLAALTNISARKRDEEQRAALLATEQQARRSLADQSQRLKSLIDAAIPGVLVTDERGMIAELNKSFCKIFGTDDDPGAFTGTPVAGLVRQIKNVFADPAEFVRRTGEALARQQPASGEQMRCADGRTLECDYWPVFVDGGHRGDLWLAWDMYDRAELERKRERTIEAELAARELAEIAQQQLADQNRRLQKAAEEKSHYLAAVSHELGTPIASIVSFAELIRQDVPGMTSDIEDYLNVIQRNAERLGHMVGELSLLDRIEAGVLPLELSAVSLPGLIAEETASAGPAAAKRGIAIEISTADGPPVQGDRHRLRQVLDNLIGNAVKFSADGSRVRVDATFDRSWWHISVRDCGIGVPPEEIGRIFDRFSRATNARIAGVPGTGLGLSIVKAISELHGGNVEASSAPGGPTTFLVSLPLQR